MIGVHAESELIGRIAQGLLHPESPISYNLVVPPGFGEDRLAEALAAILKDHPRKPLVAVLSADQIRNADSYACELFKQWTACGAELPSPGSGDALNRITQFFDLLPQSRPAIQILTRFHRILDVFDASFLGDLRDRERVSIVRSVCISPHGYDELRQRWRQRGHFFCNSDYGWSHHVELVAPQEIEDVIRAGEQQNVPAHVGKLIAAWTGGYPEPFQCVANLWVRMGRPPPTSAVQFTLRREAQKALKRFVKWLDPGENTIYRDAVITLQVEQDGHEAILLLERHPWKPVLLKDGRLRAEQLGTAVVAEYLQPTNGLPPRKMADAELWRKAAALYRGWRFTLAQKLLSLRLQDGGLPNYLAILNTHAKVMTEVYGGDTESPMTDCDWDATCAALKGAHEQLPSMRLEPEHHERVVSRYQELLRFCDIVRQASRKNSRVVDVLLGMRGKNSQVDRRAALTLLSAHLAYDCRIAGDTLACQAALPLLEQLFRAWAFISLKLNYYAAPAEDHESVWKEVENCFDTPLRRPKPGEEFTSFEAFAYFSIALHRAAHPDSNDLRPEVDQKALEKSLGVLDLRRDLAHALAIVNPALRRNYFAITNRWLRCLFACDPSIGTREELLAVVQPLPLITPDGELA